jgi:hypothetical protein
MRSYLLSELLVQVSHALCLANIVRSTTLNGKRCPQCRAPCHISPVDYPKNTLISGFIEKQFPQQTRLRKSEYLEEHVSCPEMFLFCLNVVLFPNMHMGLHLFEPRYKVMMRKCMVEGGNRRFGFVCDYSPSRGTVGVVAEIQSCTFLQDGRWS